MLLKPGFKAFETGVRHAHFAHLAHKAYNYLSQKKQMAPMKRHSTHPFLMSGAAMATKKRKRTLHTVSRRRRKTTETTRLPSVKHIKKKGGPKKFKKNKVKVSRKLRKKINKVLEGKKMHGYYKATFYSSYPLPATNTQNVTSSTINDNFGTTGVYSNYVYAYAFNPEDWLHMVSVLWNGKADSAVTRRYNDGGTIGYTVPSGAISEQPINNQTNNASEAEFTVSRSWEQYALKNNSLRTIYMKIYLCAPKRTGAEASTAQTDTGTTGNIDPILSTPASVWVAGLAEDNRLGINVSNIPAISLGLSPTSNQFFNKSFKTDVTVITLEPGQTYNYFIRGPSDFHVSMQKCFEPSSNYASKDLLMNIQKYSRCPLFVWKDDLAFQGDSTHAGTSSRVSPSVPQTQLISVERTVFARFEMPEEAGVRLGVAGTAGNANISLNRRAPAYFEATYTASGVGGFQRTDEENPITLQTV